MGQESTDFSDIQRRIQLRFPWLVIAEMAATAFAEAFAKSAGESLGQKAISALFGSGGNDGNQQLLNAIVRLEQKLDSLIYYVKEQFPQIIHQETVETMKNFASTTHDTIRSATKAFEIEQDPVIKSNLASTLNELCIDYNRYINLLIKDGVDMQPLLVHFYAVALPAYSALAPYSKGYANFLQGFAEKHAQTISQWIPAIYGPFHGVNNLYALRDGIKQKIKWSIRLNEENPNGMPYFLLYVSSGTELVIDGITYVYYGAVVGYLDRQENGVWTGGDVINLPNLDTSAKIDESLPPEEKFAFFLDKPVTGSSPQTATIAWWFSPFRDPDLKPGMNLYDVRNLAGRRFTDIRGYYSDPAFRDKERRVDDLIASTEALLKLCGVLQGNPDFIRAFSDHLPQAQATSLGLDHLRAAKSQ